MDVWPNTLQQCLDARGFQITDRDDTLTSEMDIGPAKKRPRTTDSIEDLTGVIFIDATQYSILQAFYRQTLGKGSLPFLMPHPITREQVTVRFTAPPKYDPLGGVKFQATLSMEILP